MYVLLVYIAANKEWFDECYSCELSDIESHIFRLTSGTLYRIEDASTSEELLQAHRV